MKDKNLVKRITSTLILFPILFFLIFYNRYTCDILFLLISSIVLYEYEKTFKIHKILIIITIFFGILFYLTEFIQNCEIGNILKICIPFSLLIFGLFFRKNENNTIVDAIESIAGIFYIFFPFCLFRRLAFIDCHYEWKVVFGIFCLVWSNDTFAFFVGKIFGRNKFFFKISPNKTLEGAIGGSLGVILFSIFFSSFVKIYSKEFWICSGFLVAFFGTLGDLIASALKRCIGIKDFGTLIPGHGGFFDRFDSLIFVIPYIYLAYIIFIH